ncbi:MAG: hypothetical protein JWQ96_2963 [Segetibacter sp.]|nr:hypothetical protein [Segetibacter sp.]
MVALILLQNELPSKRYVVLKTKLVLSKVYSLTTVQRLPVSLQQAWDYFSSPDNLAELTPADMGFVVRSTSHSKKMYAGQIIEYTVRPVLGIPVYWMTEITHVQDQQFFVDEQRFGPYSLWHHQHHFKPIEGGVEMKDIVHYKIPFWFIGDIANSLLVKYKLAAIFAFRKKKVEELFGIL